MFFFQFGFFLAQGQLRLAVSGESFVFRRELGLEYLGLFDALAARLFGGPLRRCLELRLHFRLRGVALRHLFLQLCDLDVEPLRRRALGLDHQDITQLPTFAFELRFVFRFIALDQLSGDRILQHEILAAVRTCHGIEGIDYDLSAHMDSLQPQINVGHSPTYAACRRAGSTRRKTPGKAEPPNHRRAGFTRQKTPGKAEPPNHRRAGSTRRITSGAARPTKPVPADATFVGRVSPAE